MPKAFSQDDDSASKLTLAQAEIIHQLEAKSLLLRIQEAAIFQQPPATANDLPGRFPAALGSFITKN